MRIASYRKVWNLLKPLAVGRGKRIPITVPIGARGYNWFGEFFDESTFTINLSQRGCCFHLNQRVGRGGLIGIRLAGDPTGQTTSSTQRLYQFAWTRREGEGWIVGASKMEQREDGTVTDSARVAGHLTQA